MPKGKLYDISALSESGKEINTDFVYNDTFPENSNIITLRDFAETGDAIRIKLPYLKSENNEADEQYIWIENHSPKAGNSDNILNMPRGIYLNMQAGADDLNVFNKIRANYISPINGFGNYDFEFVDKNSDEHFQKLKTADSLANPLNGYSLSMEMAFNKIEPNYNKIGKKTDTIKNVIYNAELVVMKGLEFNGVDIPDSLCYYDNYFNFGTKLDVFEVGRKISISENPAPTPKLT